jgi:hypothetical protein
MIIAAQGQTSKRCDFNRQGDMGLEGVLRNKHLFIGFKKILAITKETP